MVLFCFGVRNISYAVQPFANNRIDSISNIAEATSQEDISILQILGSLLNMDLNGNGQEVFNFKIDKYSPGTHQVRLNDNADKKSFECSYKTVTAIALQCLTDCNRKFSVPAHYHFLFRLKPF